MQVRVEIESPCISVCILNEETKLCEGCFRTREEIAGWATADAEERRRILESLKERQEEAGLRPRRPSRRRAKFKS